jgi:hypothetical protein
MIKQSVRERIEAVIDSGEKILLTNSFKILDGDTKHRLLRPIEKETGSNLTSFQSEYSMGWIRKKISPFKLTMINNRCKFTKEQKKQIYQAYSQAKPIKHELYAMMTRDITWAPGEFGDSGSCYFGSKSGARQMIYDHKGFVIKFYSPVNNSPVGRCWGVIDKDHFVNWNSYYTSYMHISAKNYLDLFGILLAGYFGMHKRFMGFTNNGKEAGVLHINNGCVVLDNDDAFLRDNNHYDLKWKEVRKLHQCSYCGDQNFDPDFFEEDSANGNLVCQKCAIQNLVICSLDMKFYNKQSMIKGPDDKLYYADNIDKVPFFVRIYNRELIMMDQSKLLGKNIMGLDVYTRDNEDKKLCPECVRQVIDVDVDTCQYCKAMATFKSRLLDENPNIFSTVKTDTSIGDEKARVAFDRVIRKYVYDNKFGSPAFSVTRGDSDE